MSLLSAHASWACASATALSDVIWTERDGDDAAGLTPPPARCEAVCLEQAEEGSPCVITLLCAPNSGAVISSVAVVSEARTIEVYSLSGDYCGTSRGEEDPAWHNSADEKKHFYRSLLVLETPVPSCEVKLLSLGGRTAVGIAWICVQLRFPQATQCPPSLNPGIDLQRVRAIMEEMGTTLSPGAQNLMEMVQHQQKNKADALGGLLPLLMGGSMLTSLTKGATGLGQVSSEEAGPPAGQHQQSGTHPLPSVGSQSAIPVDMSALLTAGQQSPVSPDLLPMLQSVCGQVTQLRLDAVKSPEKRRNGEKEAHMCCEGLEKALENVVEKRMEELERRLMEHVDVRLDALQRRLELTLQQALKQTPNPQ